MFVTRNMSAGWIRTSPRKVRFGVCCMDNSDSIDSSKFSLSATNILLQGAQHLQKKESHQLLKRSPPSLSACMPLSSSVGASLSLSDVFFGVDLRRGSFEFTFVRTVLFEPFDTLEQHFNRFGQHFVHFDATLPVFEIALPIYCRLQAAFYIHPLGLTEHCCQTPRYTSSRNQ